MHPSRKYAIQSKLNFLYEISTQVKSKSKTIKLTDNDTKNLFVLIYTLCFELSWMWDIGSKFATKLDD